MAASLGLWIEDELHRGASALGPAFGHIKVGSEGLRCACGQLDCLNAYLAVPEFETAGAAAKGSSSAGGTSALTGLIERATAGDAHATAAIHRQGEKLGLGLSHVVNLVNPDKIIVAVESARHGELLEPWLRLSVAANSFPAHLAATEIIFHTLDDQLWARGAAALMLRDIYSAPWTTA
jgi:transcriptional regulator of PTS gene